jgi:hypothetical protein
MHSACMDKQAFAKTLRRYDAALLHFFCHCCRFGWVIIYTFTIVCKFKERLER